MATKIDFTVRGNSEVSDVMYSKSIGVSGKCELELKNITNQDTFVVLPVSKIGAFSRIIIESESCVLQVNQSTVVSYSIPITGLLYWEFTPVYGSSLYSVAVGTTSVSPVNVKISIITASENA